MRILKTLLAVCISSIILSGCNTTPKSATNDTNTPPAWAKDAVWYQIFVERFYNGDVSNDPTLESIEGTFPENVPTTWKTTPWTQEWYKKDAWFYDLPDTGFYYGNQARRYGGDLQGVIDKLDYLSDLGINAIYFNPLNDSPSLHKYDAANYRHIDRHFGPNPELDAKIMAQETPIDPKTWQWTSADSLYLEVINVCHKKGIRVIMDYSWNHTGINFWAFKDVQENGAESDFADWYYIEEFNNPETEENETKYKGWFGVKWMPEFREVIEGEHNIEWMTLVEGNFYSEVVKQHIFNVTQRWMDPNNDGDPSDGVDGYRMDVAAEIPMGFWREYRTFIKNINPEAYLVGEIWWQAWPDKLLDPAPALGDAFDAVMHYHWYREARSFFAQTEDGMKPSEFVLALDKIAEGKSIEHRQSMMNVSASHDCPRLSTSLYNKGMYKFKAKQQDDSAYKVNKPDAGVISEQKLLLLHQFTYIGAPQIWMGDEMGMWGEDDPSNRKPLIWKEFNFEAETIDAFGNKTGFVDSVNVDSELLNYYTKLINLRKNNSTLVDGEIKFLLVDDENETLVYSRTNNKAEIITAFNLSNESRNLSFKPIQGIEFTNALTGGASLKTIDGALKIKLGAKSGIVISAK